MSYLREQINRTLKKIREAKYEEVGKFLKVFPIDTTELHPDDELFTWYSSEFKGDSLITDTLSTDIPKGELLNKPHTGKLLNALNSFSVSTDELAQAKRKGTDIRTQKANGVRKKNLKAIDEIVFLGKKELQIEGILTHQNITRFGIEDIVTGVDNLYTAINEGKNKEVLTILNSIASATSELPDCDIYSDTMLMPTTLYNLLNNTVYNNMTGQTILKVFTAGNDKIKNVYPLKECLGVGTATAEKDDVIVCFKKDIDLIKVDLPVESQEGDITKEGFSYTIPLRSKSAGVRIMELKSVVIAEIGKVSA